MKMTMQPIEGTHMEKKKCVQEKETAIMWA